MRRPTRRLSRLLGLAVVPVALVGTGAFVSASSYSVYNSVTSSPTNAFTTGTVALTNDSASGTGVQNNTGSALFTVTGMKPGSTGTKCVTVQSTGSLASAVKFYAANVSSTTVGTYITLTVNMGTATSTNGGACTGFASASTIYNSTLNGLSAASSFSNGYTTWSPTGSGTESKAFQFIYTLSSSAPNTTENQTANADFVWEAQNS